MKRLLGCNIKIMVRDVTLTKVPMSYSPRHCEIAKIKRSLPYERVCSLIIHVNSRVHMSGPFSRRIDMKGHSETILYTSRSI